MDGLKFEERLESSAKDFAETVPMEMPASVGRLQMTGWNNGVDFLRGH